MERFAWVTLVCGALFIAGPVQAGDNVGAQLDAVKGKADEAGAAASAEASSGKEAAAQAGAIKSRSVAAEAKAEGTAAAAGTKAKGEAGAAQAAATSGASGMKGKAKKKVHETAVGAKQRAAGSTTRAARRTPRPTRRTPPVRAPSTGWGSRPRVPERGGSRRADSDCPSPGGPGEGRSRPLDLPAVERRRGTARLPK